MKTTAEQFSSIIPLNTEVSVDANDLNSLDKILTGHKVPYDFDVLSIDIDTRDLDIWESLVLFRPKVVVIEINSGIMPGILSRHNQLHDGNSFSSTLLVARDKGYSLVAHTGNCIFVRNDLISSLDFPDRFLKYPELLFQYQVKWFPDRINIVRLIARKLFPRKMKFLVMRSIALIKAKVINWY